MTMEDADEREKLLSSTAEAEQRLIDAETDAERALARAEERLAKVRKEFDRVKHEFDERQRRVNEARALLTTVQKRRAEGPTIGEPDASTGQ